MAELAELGLEAPSPDEPLPILRSLDLGGGEELPLCWVPPGSCRVGSRSADPDERPVQVLELEHGTWMGQTAFTRSQWRALFGSVPEPAFPGLGESDRHPRVNVSWFESLEACLRLQERFLRKTPAPVGPHEAIAAAEQCRDVTWSSAAGFRLPSELEWEYACRGGVTAARGLVERPFGDGDEALEHCAWVLANSGERTSRVDQDPEDELRPHPFGLAQMIGNVWEWCLDLWWAERSRTPNARAPSTAHGRVASDPASAAERVNARAVLEAAKRNDLPASIASNVLEIYEAESDHDNGLTRLQLGLDNAYPPGSAVRVVRGGSWGYPARGCRSAARDRWPPRDRNRNRGFRVCLLPGPGGPVKP